MENTKIVVSDKVGEKYSADAVVFFVAQKKKNVPDIENIENQVLKQACEHGDFKGEPKDVVIDYQSSKILGVKCKRLVFIGVGHISSKINQADLAEIMRAAGGISAQICKKIKARKVCILAPNFKISKKIDPLYNITEGILLGDYKFDKYKSKKEEKNPFAGIKELRFLVSDKSLKQLRDNLARAQNAVESVFHARDMANEPGNNWTPDHFAEYAQSVAKKHDLTCKVFDKNKLIKLGMGGIIAVNSGSDNPPKMIILEHFVSKKAKTLLLVGKGLTFDSGGISLKPAAGMEDMKYDMCGGAAVLAAMNYIGFMKPKFNIIAIVPATDNMSGGSALKPGDVIYHYNKMSSEIINTDAEGRLILADALAYGIETYSPDCVIDLATLTGAVIIGLGHHYSGLLANNDELADGIIEAGKNSGEPVWRLPLGKEYSKQIDSKIADMKNTGGRPAGTITAAEYLHKFVGDTAWAHIDIAGTAWGFTEKSYIPEGGPTGICVRTLIDFVENWK